MRRFLHGLLGVLMLAPIPFAEAVTPRKDLVFADLGQPQTNPWVINRHRFQECVARALNIEQPADGENSESKHVSQAESLVARQPDAMVFNPLTSLLEPGSKTPRTQSYSWYDSWKSSGC